MPRAAVLAVVMAALLCALVAQPSAQPTRTVQGRVVADDTGDPISNAKVGFATTAAARATLTDRDGRFALDVPAGVARLTFSKTGYARRDIRMQPADGVATVRLARTAVITGRVVYSGGEPAVNVAVSAGVPVPGSQAFSVRATGITDDRGEYRLSGLMRERVVVGAQVRGSLNGMRYFPGVESVADAELLEVNAGDEIDGIDLAISENDDGMTTANGGFVFISMFPLRRPGPDEQTTVVRGRVVSATGGVVAGALVRLTQQARLEGATARSDGDGRFAFTVVPGRFLIAASKTGYSSDAGLPGMSITVPASGANTELTLTPWSTIAGRVADEAGDPVQDARLEIFRLQFQDGRRRLVSAGLTRPTDDRGAFRVFGVPPGQYILSASAGDVSTAELPGYVRTFYPGVTDPAFSPFISIAAGQLHANADITIGRQPTARVTGIVRDARGQPGLVGSLSLIPSQSSSSLAAAVGARVGDGGVFEFPNVPPGRYVIQAYRGAKNRFTEGEFGALPVTVGERDVEGITIQAATGSVIAGQLSFAGSTPDAAPPRAGIDIEAVPSDPDLAPLTGRATADILPDWTFRLSGISGPRRLEVTRTPPGWAVEAIRVRGIDVTDQPLVFGTAAQSVDDVDVVLTDRVTRITGRAVDGSGRAAAGATVVVFAPSNDRWYAHSRHVRAAVAAADGSFAVEGLPPGQYYMAAVAAAPLGGTDAWQDPAFLESLVGPARSVSVGDGGRADVALTLVEPR